MATPYEFTTSRGNLIRLSLYGKDNGPDSPLILFLHGFKGFKDWGFTPPNGDWFADLSYRFLTMNFSHNGVGSDVMEFTELDKFRENTHSLEVEEAEEVIAALGKGELGDISVEENRLGLLGHSRGGGVALLAGINRPEVRAVCTWASVSTFDRYMAADPETWKENGFIEVPNARTGQIMQVGYGLYEDLQAHRDVELNIKRAVERTDKPLCIIHGTADMAVPYSDAESLYGRAPDGMAELHLIKESGHTFEAKHPFEGSTEALDKVRKATRDFFRWTIGRQGW